MRPHGDQQDKDPQLASRPAEDYLACDPLAASAAWTALGSVEPDPTLRDRCCAQPDSAVPSTLMVCIECLAL
jgi:hypothetical protein